MEKINLPIEELESDKVSPLNPDLGWLYKMLKIIIPFILLSYLIFYIFAYLIVGNISIEKEKEFFGNYGLENQQIKPFEESKLTTNIKDLFEYNIYVNDSDEINAYALLGGNILLTQGLIDSLEYEEELIFIIGHEIEHIKNRDVLKGALTEIPFRITLSFLGFDLGTELINFSDIALNYISQDTEINADEGGIKHINDLGLNLECSSNFFKNDNIDFSKYLQFISTHPSNKERIKNIEQKAQNITKKCTPLNY